MHRRIGNQYRFCSMCSMYADLHAFYSKNSENSLVTRDSMKVLTAKRNGKQCGLIWGDIICGFFRFGLVQFCLIQFGEIVPHFCGLIRIYEF